MDILLALYYIGIIILFGSHIYMLISPTISDKMKKHAYINLLGGLMIAYYFMNNENFISF